MSAPGVRPTLKPLYRDGERFIRIRTHNKWVEVHERHLEKLIDGLLAVRAAPLACRECGDFVVYQPNAICKDCARAENQQASPL